MGYLAIRIHTLRPNHRLNFDVFVKVAEKHIHYIRNSEPFDADRLSRLKQKGVKKLYIKRDEEPLYFTYLDQGLVDLADASTQVAARGNLANDALVTDAENIESTLDTEHGFKSLEGRVGKIIQFLSSEKSALKSMMDAAGAAEDVFQHCASVSSLAMGLAIKVTGLPDRELYDLAVSGLVHDLGKAKLGVDSATPLENLPPEQQELFKKHPSAALDLLQTKKYITPGVLRLVMDHEEVGVGQGYPDRKSLAKMHLTSRILNLVNAYDRFAMTRKASPVGLVQDFFQEKGPLFDGELMSKLGEVLMGK
ncbi:MAG TPA: HD domain-containing phosphohydrolase [Bdellovibrionota bacterium]|nr:HD domain-containing phosphohydrolase [Bdellovibrionota bacterium]